MSDEPLFDEEPSATESTVVTEWLWRIAVTVGIVIAYQWWQGPTNAVPDSGNRLEREWKLLEPSEEEEEQYNTARRGRAALLDKLEDDAKNKPILYDDIEDDDVKPSAPPEELDVPSSEPEAPEASAPVRSRRSRRTPAPAPAPSYKPPPMKATDGQHPGLGGFSRWYNVEASLYRIYTVGRTDGEEVHPPFIPKSERGRVALKIRAHNNYRHTIACYWVDYKGKEVQKGKIKQGQTFHQTTWIGHPWVFREEESGKLLCHYIPYKVIANTEQVPTVDDDDAEVGVQEFTIVSLGQRQHLADEGEICFIEDNVFPTAMETSQEAAAWTFQEMSRIKYLYIDTVTKYLTNVVLHPADTKYRQIRIANPTFFQQVWSSPARGLLLAAGFVEEGAHAELGSAASLPRERVQEISTLLFYIEKWKHSEEHVPINGEQPTGADGYGRANFGRPGMQ